MPTDPMFSRWVTRDVEFHGVAAARGRGAPPVHRRRQPRPGALGSTGRLRHRAGRSKPALAFGSGPHVCLGMHVARAEMAVGINALLDRLPNLRLDPDAEPPRFIGMYERGATAIPVVFGPLNQEIT